MQKGVRIAVTKQGDSLPGGLVGPAPLCAWPVQAVLAGQAVFPWCALVITDSSEPGAPVKLAASV